MLAEPFPNDFFEWIESPHMASGYTVQRLAEIKFREGRIKFNFYNNVASNSRHSGMVQNIQIIDKKNTVIKTVEFTQSFLYAFNEVLAGDKYSINKLDLVQFKDKNGATIDKYAFEYYPMKYPSAEQQGYMDVRHCDWWGYYNASGKRVMLPPVTVRFVGSGGGLLPKPLELMIITASQI